MYVLSNEIINLLTCVSRIKIFKCRSENILYCYESFDYNWTIIKKLRENHIVIFAAGKKTTHSLNWFLKTKKINLIRNSYFLIKKNNIFIKFKYWEGKFDFKKKHLFIPFTDETLINKSLCKDSLYSFKLQCSIGKISKLLFYF